MCGTEIAVGNSYIRGVRMLVPGTEKGSSPTMAFKKTICEPMGSHSSCLSLPKLQKIRNTRKGWDQEVSKAPGKGREEPVRFNVREFEKQV